MWSKSDKEIFDFLESYRSLRESELLSPMHEIADLRNHKNLYFLNYLAFKKSLTSFNSNNLLSQNANSMRRWKAQYDISRNLFNAIASSDAFVSFVKTKKRSYGFNFYPELERRVINTPSQELIKLLRNIMLHSEQPNTSNQRKFTRLKEGIKVEDRLLVEKTAFAKIDVRQMRKYPNGCLLLDQQDESFDILPILEAQHETLNDFYGWLLLRYFRENKGKIDGMLESIENFYSKFGSQMDKNLYPPNKYQVRYLKSIYKKVFS